MVANGLHAVPSEYHAPDVQEVTDEYDQRQHGGTQEDPINLDSDREDDRRAAGSASDVSGTLTPKMGKHTVTDRMQDHVPPGSPERAFGPPKNPARSTPRRQNPRGILLGVWKRAGPVTAKNAVYGSRDVRNRINRRISKLDLHGTVVLGGNFDVRRTSCSHEEIDYLPAFHGMTREQVNSHIMPLLDAMKREEVARRDRSRSPTADAARRHAQRRNTASKSNSGASTTVFQTRGARFFGTASGQIYSMEA